MIEKMKFLTLTGPREDIDRVVDTYLSKYEIHLENALSQLKTVSELRPFAEGNPYVREYRKATELMEQLAASDLPVRDIGIDQALDTVHALESTLAELTSQKEEWEKQRELYVSSLNQVSPFIGLN